MLASPNPNVAQKTVVAITNASTKIKENIIQALSLQMPKPKYTSENFFLETFANFTKTKVPKTQPDFTSNSGSMYWYTDEGVIRASDHWKSYIRSCDWYLDGKVVNKFAAGFCKWEDFRPIEFDIGEMKIGSQTIETHVRKPIEHYLANPIKEELPINQEELTKRLNKIIADAIKEFEGNPELQEDMRKGLIVSARKWHYELTQTFKVLNTNLVNNASALGLLVSDIANLGFGNQNLLIDRFRPYLDYNAKGIALIENYEKQVKSAIKALSAEPPKIVKVSRRDGVEYTYTMSARNRAEIAARYEANLKDLQDLTAKGVRYVWTTSHPNCSNRCKPHQGKLYSLDPNDKNGSINGIPYTFLGDVLKLNEGNSIINGYNCRHRLVEYQPGSRAPAEYTEREIKKEYAIDARQRSYENQIRQLKTEERLLRASGDVETASRLRKRWRRLNKSYEIFSLKNNRPFYRWRTRVTEDEDLSG